MNHDVINFLFFLYLTLKPNFVCNIEIFDKIIHIYNMYLYTYVYIYSLGGPQPYVPVGLDEEKDAASSADKPSAHQKRARVLCSYDAKDATELNLTGNEV